MGVLRLMSTLIKHPAMIGALSENPPIFECLLIDYACNIHYVLQQTITELNEILYYTYHNGYGDYFTNLEISIDKIKELIDYYEREYHIGKTYGDISEKISDDLLTNIIFEEVIKYTKMLILSINNGGIKKIYIAMDGTPSMAKIQEQRNRRYIGAYINNIKQDIVKKLKFNNKEILQIDLFKYRAKICTGTNFMDRIQEALFNLDIGLDIDVSTLNIRGEGEKKIIAALDNLTEYNSFCIMSPDSDMFILMGILENNKKFKGKQFYHFRIDYQNQNQYQFLDIIKFVQNLKKYFSAKISKNISRGKMLDLFFMLSVFGNDFLPKLEPLNITFHFDFICQICLDLAMSGYQLINNGNLSYDYLVNFLSIINKDVLKMSIEKDLYDRYTNYNQLCKKLSLDKKYLYEHYHHPKILPIDVSFTNFDKYLKNVKNGYNKLYNYLCQTMVTRNNLQCFYRELHENPLDSYLILVLPRFLKFPNMPNKNDPFVFFESFVQYMNIGKNLHEIRFYPYLIPKKNKLNKKQSKLTSYQSEMEKINKGFDQYSQIFGIEEIKLVSYNLESGKILDHRHQYYQKYVGHDINKKQIENMVYQYLCGIEWLYQYYIIGKKQELSGWHYQYTKPPLVQDIITYLIKNPGCQTDIIKHLESYPENNMDSSTHYHYVTPNEYTNANIAPNLSDVLHLIDGKGMLYPNRCQFKWNDLTI